MTPRSPQDGIDVISVAFSFHIFSTFTNGMRDTGPTWRQKVHGFNCIPRLHKTLLAACPQTRPRVSPQCGKAAGAWTCFAWALLNRSRRSRGPGVQRQHSPPPHCDKMNTCIQTFCASPLPLATYSPGGEQDI